MAVDTAQKRMSAIYPSSPWRGPLVDATEAGTTQGNRQAAAYLYSGITATAASELFIGTATSKRTGIVGVATQQRTGIVGTVTSKQVGIVGKATSHRDAELN